MTQFYFFDFHGSYLGYLNGEGSFRDPNGEEWARLREDRRVVGLDGREHGYLNAQGCYFEPSGTCRGYLRDWPNGDEEREL